MCDTYCEAKSSEEPKDSYTKRPIKKRTLVQRIKTWLYPITSRFKKTPELVKKEIETGLCDVEVAYLKPKVVDPMAAIMGVYWHIGHHWYNKRHEPIQYDNWVIGIENQKDLPSRIRNKKTLAVTEVLPFDTVYTGQPAVKLL